MEIEQRLLRREDEDIIEIGRIADEILSGEKGKLLYALTNGQIWEKLALKKDDEPYEEKVELLGELRSYVNILKTLERCVNDRNVLLAERSQEQDKKPIDEPTPHYGSSGVV
jgi:hypothetical protein